MNRLIGSEGWRLARACSVKRQKELSSISMPGLRGAFIAHGMGVTMQKEFADVERIQMR